uniref:Uncharacterized protein n=1 Tax=Setaria viridis TaxID=4556 RepID=A0A4U6UBE5_SETVI|nr:hypothetical protein SEVIR_6G224700v2 [Setaria viridis]
MGLRLARPRSQGRERPTPRRKVPSRPTADPGSGAPGPSPQGSASSDPGNRGRELPTPITETPPRPTLDAGVGLTRVHETDIPLGRGPEDKDNDLVGPPINLAINAPRPCQATRERRPQRNRSRIPEHGRAARVAVAAAPSDSPQGTHEPRRTTPEGASLALAPCAPNGSVRDATFGSYGNRRGNRVRPPPRRARMPRLRLIITLDGDGDQGDHRQDQEEIAFPRRARWQRPGAEAGAAASGPSLNTQSYPGRSKLGSDSEHLKEDEFAKEEAMKENLADRCSGDDTLKKRKRPHVARRLFSADD